MDIQKAINYIKRRTKALTPSERKVWVDKLADHFRRESIDYVNGKPIPVSDEPETIGEAMLEKEEEPTGALID